MLGKSELVAMQVVKVYVALKPVFEGSDKLR